MTDEKKMVIDGLRLSYNGLFDVVEFYKAVEDWITEKGYEKETKKKLEHVNPKGKNIEWNIEIWKMPNDWSKTFIVMRALFKNVTEIEMNKSGAKKRFNKGEVLVMFDAWLETDLEAKWHQKAPYHFLKTLFDKYIYRFWDEKQFLTDPVAADTYALHKRLKSFFELYKY